jgi:hypothetical protein
LVDGRSDDCDWNCWDLYLENVSHMNDQALCIQSRKKNHGLP